MNQVCATVVRIEPYTPRYVRARLYAPEVAGNFQAGQFLMARCGDGFALYLRRPLFPIRVASTTTSRIDVIFYPDEPGLIWLSQLQPDMEVDVIGALGRGFTLVPSTRRLLLLAQDDGIIPLLALLPEARARQMEVVLITENATGAMVYPPALLPRAVEYNVATLDGSWGYHGKALNIAVEAVAWADQICAAGDTSWYSNLRRVVETQKFKLTRGFAQVVISVPLACGMGVCLGCATETARGVKQVCVDGPVFDLRDIA